MEILMLLKICILLLLLLQAAICRLQKNMGLPVLSSEARPPYHVTKVRCEGMKR